MIFSVPAKKIFSPDEERGLRSEESFSGVSFSPLDFLGPQSSFLILSTQTLWNRTLAASRRSSAS